MTSPTIEAGAWAIYERRIQPDCGNKDCRPCTARRSIKVEDCVPDAQAAFTTMVDAMLEDQDAVNFIQAQMDEQKVSSWYSASERETVARAALVAIKQQVEASDG